MLRTISVGMTALAVIAGSSLAYGQSPSAGPASTRITPADLNALTDARIAIVKAALQLTPDQERYWPAIEDAIRARAKDRMSRLEAVTRRVPESTRRCLGSTISRPQEARHCVAAPLSDPHAGPEAPDGSSRDGGTSRPERWRGTAAYGSCTREGLRPERILLSIR
jgi:hypothetical protein